MHGRRNSTPLKPRELGFGPGPTGAHSRITRETRREVLRLPGFSPHLASWCSIHVSPATGGQCHADHRAHKRSQRREHRIAKISKHRAGARSGNLDGPDGQAAAPSNRPDLRSRDKLVEVDPIRDGLVLLGRRSRRKSRDQKGRQKDVPRCSAHKKDVRTQNSLSSQSYSAHAGMINRLNQTVP